MKTFFVFSALLLTLNFSAFAKEETVTCYGPDSDPAEQVIIVITGSLSQRKGTVSLYRGSPSGTPEFGPIPLTGVQVNVFTQSVSYQSAEASFVFKLTGQISSIATDANALLSLKVPSRGISFNNLPLACEK